MDWQSRVLSLLQWIESQGPEAALWIIGLQALFVILVIPGPFFTGAAGFLFGMKLGLPVAVAGSMLGAVVAYAAGRLFPHSPTNAHRIRPSWVVLLEQFIRGGGWKIVLATRLIPFFPFKLSNYLFGWMRFPFRPFFIGTFVGIIPMTAVSVAAGSVAADVASLLRPGEHMAKQWPWSVAGLAIALALFAYAGYQGRRKFKEIQNRGDLRGVTSPQPDRGPV